MATTKTAAQKRATFVEKANKRVRYTLERIRKLGDLASTANEADKKSIVEALQAEVARVEARLNGKAAETGFELK